MQTKQLTKGDSTIDIHQINPSEFQINLDLVIPYTGLTVEKKPLALDEGRSLFLQGKQQYLPYTFSPQENDFIQTPGGRDSQPDRIGIAPMGLDTTKVTSELSLKVNRLEFEDDVPTPAGDDLADHFSFRPVVKRAPRALWGHQLQQDKNGPRYVESALGGVEILPAKPPTPGKTERIDKESLPTVYQNPVIRPSSIWYPWKTDMKNREMISP